MPLIIDDDQEVENGLFDIYNPIQIEKKAPYCVELAT
jgi:hypothetical protein